MNEKQIEKEIFRYIQDESYNYAVLIDGEWGSGKTYFVKNILCPNIDESKTGQKTKYISLYGCKTIDEIQENLAWEIADEVRRNIGGKFKSRNKVPSRKNSKVKNNILLSSKKIINEVVKQNFPSKTIYDIASDWIYMKSYIFIFDDLERCECPLNEVFGYINGLVEHEGVKVILIANEEEISTGDVREQDSGVGYIVAANNEIDWPQEEQRVTYIRNRDPNEKIKIGELKRRKELLFPSRLDNSEYKKIKEKLIGVTLEYEPNIPEVIEKMIDTICHEKDLKTILNGEQEQLIRIMNWNCAHNLRSFQFFLSKIMHVYDTVNGFSIEKEYRERLIKELIGETFEYVVRYKVGGIPNGTIQGVQSKALKDYVEKGGLNETKLEKDVRDKITEYKSNIEPSDPCNQLYDYFYCHSQEWCEKQLNDLLKRLADGKYPVTFYKKIILAIENLQEVGFDKTYLEKTKKIMIDNIEKEGITEELNEDLWFIEEPERRERIKCELVEINESINKYAKEVKKSTIKEILESKKWISRLEEYTNARESQYVKKSAVFKEAEAEDWYYAIYSTSIEEIVDFRHWLESIYSRRSKTAFFAEDAEILIQLYKLLNPEQESDLIRKLNIRWLKGQIGDIIRVNLPDFDLEGDKHD